MNKKKLDSLLVPSYTVLKETVSPQKDCDCNNKDNPLVCAHYPTNYRCEFNLGQFSVGKTVYINCTARIPGE